MANRRRHHGEVPFVEIEQQQHRSITSRGFNSTVLLNCYPEKRIETSRTLTFATRASATASTLTPVTFNSDENINVRNNSLTDRHAQSESQQTQLTCEGGE